MNLLKLLQRTIESQKLASTELNKNCSQQELDNLADTFIRIINRRQLKTTKQIKRAKNAIYNKLVSQCEKNPQISQAMIDQIKKAVFTKIDEKLAPKLGNFQNTIKVNRRRQLQSSDEEQFSKDDEDEAETSQPSSKTKKIHKLLKSITIKNRKKRKYETYDQEFKQQVCTYAEVHGTDEASRKYHLPSRKVMNWFEAHQLNQLGRGRKAFDPVMQFNLCIWILRKIWDQIPLTQKIIRQKAETLKTLPKPFNGSKGWLEKFFLRHVELKSCFDTRNKEQLRAQCARYHRYAFSRLGKDSTDLIKHGEDISRIVIGDLSRIIYFKSDHPLLKFRADKYLDKQAVDNRPFYNYDQIKDIQIKKFEEDEDCEEEDEDEDQNNQGKQEEDQQCGQSDEGVTPGQYIGTKSEQSYEQQQEQFQQSMLEQALYKSEEQQSEDSSEIAPKKQTKYEESVKYQIYDQSSDQDEKIAIKSQSHFQVSESNETNSVKKQEDDE